MAIKIDTAEALEVVRLADDPRHTDDRLRLEWVRGKGWTLRSWRNGEK